jgi:hypothetical protein
MAFAAFHGSSTTDHPLLAPASHNPSPPAHSVLYL